MDEEIGTLCAQCVADVPSNCSAEECNSLMGSFEVTVTCQPCPTELITGNTVSLVTAGIGAVSTLLCVEVVASIVANRRDLTSLRDRIIIGLLMSNAIFSSSNAVPVYLVDVSSLSCGQLSLPFPTILFVRAWWFGGKYALLAYEIVLICVSITVLTRGTLAITPRVEMALHLGCVLSFTCAFAMFYVLAVQISVNGYNAQGYTPVEAQFNHGSDLDDLNDDGLTRAYTDSNRFKTGRDAYNKYVWCGSVLAFFLSFGFVIIV